MKSVIKISSKRNSIFHSKLSLDNENYDVETEDLGIKKCKIVTRIYLKGEILSTMTSDYKDIMNHPEFDKKLNALIDSQHKNAAQAFVKERSRPEKSKAHFAEEIRSGLKNRKYEAALDSAEEALKRFPFDPFFMSHCGHLTAVFRRKSADGIKMCQEAIKILRQSKSADTVVFLPLFYMHLGRAYVAGRKKKAAIDAFQEGLKYDSGNAELLSEIKGLGTRKSPVIPFLERSNPINVFLGKLRHKMNNKSA